MKYKYLFLLFTILSACNQPAGNSGSTDTIAVKPATDTPAIAIASEANAEEEELPADTNTIVTFPEFTITVEGFADDPSELAKEDLGKDTILISPAEIGQLVTNTRVLIESSVLTDIQVDFSFRNVAIIMNEGPICVMYEWKSFTSAWERLPFRDGSYRFRELTEEDMSQFPEINVEEWKAQVSKHCGQEYYDLIKDNHAIREGAADITIDEMFIRVSATRKSDGSPYVKILKFSIPIGC